MRKNKTKKKDPTKPIVVNVEFFKMEGLGGGFRQEWLLCKNKKFRAGLDSGAGLSNPYLIFWIEKNGKIEYFTADMRTLFNALIEKEMREDAYKK